MLNKFISFIIAGKACQDKLRFYLQIIINTSCMWKNFPTLRPIIIIITLELVFYETTIIHCFAFFQVLLNRNLSDTKI